MVLGGARRPQAVLAADPLSHAGEAVTLLVRMARGYASPILQEVAVALRPCAETEGILGVTTAPGHAASTRPPEQAAPVPRPGAIAAVTLPAKTAPGHASLIPLQLQAVALVLVRPCLALAVITARA